MFTEYTACCDRAFALCTCEIDDRDRCRDCGEAYPLDTAEVIGGETFCSDCGWERREAMREEATKS